MKFIKIIGWIFLGLVLILAAFFFLTDSEEFKDSENPVANSPIKMFDKSAVVFDAVTIYGTSKVPVAKLKHTAQVVAQWLDNNEDGVIDDLRLQEALQKNKATMIMSENGFSIKAMLKIQTQLTGSSIQDLYANETNNPERRDASQEETHHLIINVGYQKVWPQVFSENKKDNSLLYKIWKYADEKGYYYYNDPTCNDACKVTEFVYLATAAYLGSDIDLASDEMRLKNREALQEKVPEIINIFESKAYAYPIYKWPNGNYKFTQNIKYFWGAK